METEKEEEEEEEKEQRSSTNNIIGVPSAMEELPLGIVDSWTFDQIFSLTPTFIISPATSEQSLSPLWTFSCVHEDDKNHVDDNSSSQNVTLTSSALQLIGSPDQPTRKPSNSDGKMMLPILTSSQDQDPMHIIKDKVTRALRDFKESSGTHFLAQLWAPSQNMGRYVLTTSGQPFILDPNCTGLYQYRMASLMFAFSLEGENDDLLDLPARVFRRKLPEWSPNVQYYSDKEYRRLNHALSYNVRGTLALPVFEPSRPSFVGVLELILTSQKINYAPEVDKVCKALKAVNLKSSDILDTQKKQIINVHRHHALAEILEVLTVVCETHNIPLAQTWVPCCHPSVLADGGGFMEQACMSISEVAFYVIDAHMWGFREACAEHHLQKGQGVVGQVFASRGPCFCEDITHFAKTEYPLVHYARMFGLVGSLAICLKSTHTGDDDYILEFFLPPSMADSNDLQTMLGSMSTFMKQHSGSLNVASGEAIEEIGELEEELSEIESLYTFERNRLLTIPEPLEKEKRPVAEANCKTAPILLPREDIEQQYGRTMKEAAKNLNVSLSTLKRKCKSLHISQWQGPNFVKRKENEQYNNQTDTNEADKRTIPGSLVIKARTYFNEYIVTIKAEYAEDMIKFHLGISEATFISVEEEIGKKFKLSHGTYKLKYLDEDKDWILLASDEDMTDCIKSSRNLKGTSIRLRVLLLT